MHGNFMNFSQAACGRQVLFLHWFFFFLNVVGTCQVYYLFGFVVVFPENSRNTAICIDLDVKCPSLGFIRLKPWASASGGVLESCGTLRR